MDKGTRNIVVGVAIFIIGLVVWSFATGQDEEGDASSEGSDAPVVTLMKITSPVFAHNETIPTEYTCDGRNVGPPLVFDNVPEGTRSLALIMDDPDVPTDRRPSGVFDHWVVFNMPPDTSGIDVNEIPPGIHGANSAGRSVYTGPCPPDREHRYFFRLYALDDMLALDQGATKEEVLEAMQGHILAEAELMGRYDRPDDPQI